MLRKVTAASSSCLRHNEFLMLPKRELLQQSMTVKGTQDF